jgi:transcription-repair coupling factor (superfamily II helicase)
VERELARAGQVFYIHNRVNDMETHVEYLQSLVPDARIAHAHGQMDEVELENIMIDFMEHRYDILVSTTIIESGVDMPRVNTIIVNRADSFGLSQLYQLKGRVGRSDRQAYAYFFFPRHIVPNETAMKRLTVISEFSELGSGYRVAMKDMEIRGAGNILGREQSGCIVDVGFDLYVSMLEEAVRRLRGEKPLRTFRTPVFLGINTFIPDSFVSDVKQKIELYKRMEAAETPEELDALETEIADRFGELPTEVTTLMELQRIRALASTLWIEEIMETERTVRIRLSAESRLDIHRVMEHMSKDKRYRIDPRDALVIVFNPETEDSEKKLHEVKKWLQQMS